MIEVGEYIRTDDGIIIKYEYLEENENYEVFFGQKGKCYTFEDMEEFEDFIKQRVVKHSKNIIDLIEVGDVVTIYLRQDIKNDEFTQKFEILSQKMLEEVKKDSTSINYLKSIVTKEQYKQIEYIVKE